MKNGSKNNKKSLVATPKIRLNRRPKGRKAPVRRVAGRKERGGSTGDSLPPLISIWAENAAGLSKSEKVVQPKGTGSGPIIKGPRAVVPAEQKSLMRKKSKPLLLNGVDEDDDVDIVGKFKKIHPKKGRKTFIERERFESSPAREFRSKQLGSMFSPLGSRVRRSKVNPSVMSVAEQKRADLPETFEYDLTMYNSPHSRGMQVGKHEVRLIPHPCIPDDDVRINIYIEGRATKPEIPPETTRDFLNNDYEELSGGPPPVAPPRRTRVEIQADKAKKYYISKEAPPVPAPRRHETPSLVPSIDASELLAPTSRQEKAPPLPPLRGERRPPAPPARQQDDGRTSEHETPPRQQLARTRRRLPRFVPPVPDRRPEERKSGKVDDKKMISSLKKSDSVKSLHKEKKP